MNDKAYKNVDIGFIETKVPEDMMILAEEVIDQGSVSGLTQKKKDEWEAIVINRNIHYSVVTRLKGDHLDSWSCNCTNFNQKGMCGHVVAMLIHLRKQIQETTKRKGLKKSRSGRSKVVNLSALLKNLTREELEQFVLSKARTDRNFKLLLQARFIEKMPQDQLATFIESTFPVLTKANEKIGANRLKLFLDISDELVQYFKNLIAQEDLIEAYQLIFLLLKKSFYIKFHLKSEHARFYKQHKNFLSSYIEVYKLIEAPEYKEHIIDQLKELLSASYISASLQSEKKLWMIFYEAAHRRAELQSIVHSFFEKSHINDYESYYFIKMLALVLMDVPEDKIAEIKRKDMQECYRIIQHLRTYKDYPACQEAMHLFYNFKSLNHPLAKLITEHINVLPEYVNDLFQKSIDYYIKYKDALYLDFIRTISNNWKSDKKILVQEIIKKGKPEHLIKYYLTTNNLPEAITVLRNNLTFDILRQYDREISEQDSEACYGLYRDLMKNYLDQHFGIHAQDFTTRIFNRINMIGQKEWLNPLKLFLKEQFKERKFLFR